MQIFAMLFFNILFHWQQTNDSHDSLNCFYEPLMGHINNLKNTARVSVLLLYWEGGDWRHFTGKPLREHWLNISQHTTAPTYPSISSWLLHILSWRSLAFCLLHGILQATSCLRAFAAAFSLPWNAPFLPPHNLSLPTHLRSFRSSPVGQIW